MINKFKHQAQPVVENVHYHVVYSKYGIDYFAHSPFIPKRTPFILKTGAGVTNAKKLLPKSF